MRKLLIMLIFCLIVALLHPTAPSQAQEEEPPLPENIYFTRDGYLYLWDLATDTVQQLTDTGYINRLHHSPAGPEIVFNWYNSRNPAISGYEFGQDFEGGDVYLIRESGDLWNITRAPDFVRSELAWSSNGQQVVWWEGEIVPYEDTEFESVVDPRVKFFNVQESNKFYHSSFTGGIDAGFYFIPTPFVSGNFYAIITYSAGSGIGLNLDSIYQTDRDRILVSEWDQAGRVTLLDVQTPDGPYLGLYYEEYAQLDLLNPITKTTEALTDSTIELRTDQPDSLRWRHNPAEGLWSLFDTDENQLTEVEGFFPSYPLALNSAGDATVYYADGALNILYVDGSTLSQPMEPIGSVAWGAQAWHRVDGVSLPPVLPEQASPLTTENCRDSDLGIGMTGHLRAEYGQYLYKHINPLRFVDGILTDGTHLTLLDGPFCTVYDPHNLLWQVEAYGVTGWVELSNWSFVADE